MRDVAPASELCDSGADEDCDGEIDETACADCAPANSVTGATQTKKTSVKLSPTPARDGVQTKGTFVVPAGAAFAPDTQPFTLRLTDGSGATYYVGTIPAGRFVASGSRRRFKFSDSTLALAGIKTAKFSLAGDGVTVKYAFKMQRLDRPAFTPGTGTALVKVGPRCFVDPADACTVAPSGAARCE